MANVFWVSGGTGNTNSTTNWSTTTGGPSGAAVPGNGDDAIFDGASGTNTVTVAAAFVCHSWNMTGSGARTVTGGNTIAVGGVATLTTAAVFKVVSGITWSTTGIITLDNRSGGITVTTNGATLPTVTIASTNTAAINFADSINCSAGVNGILNTNGTGAITFTSGITVTCKIFQVNGASSAITYSGVTINATATTAGPISFLAAPTLTGNSSSQLNATAWTSSTCAFSTASLPGTVTLTLVGNTAGVTLNGTGTFTNLTINGPAAAPTSNKLVIGGSLTVSGAMIWAGASQRQRLLVYASTGLITLPTGQLTITCNGTATISNVDFQSIKTAGTAGTWAGASIGSGGNITGITATTPATVYWVGGNSGAWSAANKWATASGGSAGSAGAPLPQDTVVFDAASGGITANSSTVTCDQLFIGPLDTSAVAATGFVISCGSSLPTLFRGSVTLSSTTTVNFTQNIGPQFWKDSGTLTITLNGGSIAIPVQVAGATRKTTFYSSTTIAGATTWTNHHIEANTGTLDISQGNFDAWALITQSASNVTLGGYFYTFRANDSTQTAGFVTVNSSANTVTGLVGAQIKLVNSGATVTTGSNVTIDVLDMTGASGTISTTGVCNVNTLALPPGLTFALASGTTHTMKMVEAIGKSGSLITLKSTVAANPATLKVVAGIINLDWCSIKDITASGGATFYPGPNSTYSTGNTGWQVSGSTPLSGPARQQASMTGCGGY